MSNSLYNISQVLGITIIHSLWQGLVIYFVLRVALLFSGQIPASKKYWLAVSSLLAITVWFAFTLLKEIQVYNWLAVKPASLSALPLLVELPSGIRQFNIPDVRYYYSIAAYLPYITVIYIAGLLFNTTRLVLARKKNSAIRQSMSVDVSLQTKLQKFKTLLGIDSRVTIGLSNLIDVPCMVGYFKPLILLPFALSTYLSTEEIEAILLHELSHLKRNDYVVNLLQQVLAILLFFNPCAQLINRIINEERENACDDMVVDATANPLLYAKALLKLEQTRENNWQFALAATGKKYYLLNRIQRIMKTKNQTPSVRPALLAMLILTIGVGIVATLSPQIAQGKVSISAIKPVIPHLFQVQDTTRKKIVKKKVHTKTSHSVTHINGDFYVTGDDKKMDELNAEIQKHSEYINKYFNSGDFKAIQDEIQQKGKEIQEYYNNPQLKKLQEEMADAGANFSKNWSDNDKLKDLQTKMGDSGKEIGTYYSSPEFKKLNTELKKKYGIPDHYYYDDRDRKDENYKKYEAELQSHIPAQIKAETDQLKTMGEQMRSSYNSSEFKAQSERLKMLGDSMKHAFGSTQVKQRQMDMKKLSEQMHAYQKNPQLKKEQALLKESVKKLTDYIKSPEYQKRLEQMKKDYSQNYKHFYRDSTDKPEKAEKPEKPEAPEKQEN